jgi:hypothetical protein
MDRQAESPDSLAKPPFRLLHQLAHGEIADDDVDLLQAMLRVEGLPECPPKAQARASRLAQSHQHPKPRAREVVEHATRLAQMVFDSWSPARLAPVRSQSALPRQLLLRALDVEISLHVQPIGINHVTLIGQVLDPIQGTGEARLVRHAGSPDGEPQTVVAHAAEQVYGPVPVDDLGEFLIDDIRPGRYVLSIQLGTWRIESVALELSGGSGDLGQ